MYSLDKTLSVRSFIRLAFTFIFFIYVFIYVFKKLLSKKEQR